MTHSSTNEMAAGIGPQRAEELPPTEPLLPPKLLALASEVRSDHSALLDVAYDEYCRAMDRGESIDPAQFAAQFPEVEQSLLELLEVHSFVVGNSLLTAVEPDIHWPTPGEVFLGFELLEEIGQGAFSRVFLAREVGLGNRRVVVKVSQKGTTEAHMLGVLDHPNIIPVHSITADHAIQLSALCMPYLGRTTAAEWIQTRFKASSARRAKSQKHMQSVIEIGMGVCQGLKFAHARQILHCDIKPSNILITHDGEPVLLDFNLSTNPSQDLHHLGGTLMYMAPEQILRASGDRTATITESTDVFCLGATLYQMAMGQLPFPIDTSSHPRLKDVMHVALEARRAFRERMHPLPGPLLSLLRDALAFDPDDRIASASEFFERLVTCQNQLTRPHFRSIGTVAAALVFSLGLFSLYLANRNSPPPEPFEKTDQTDSAGAIIADADPTPVEPLQRAKNAETDGIYAEAIPIYRQVLAEWEEDPAITDHERAALKHSLAFCLMMDGRYGEAHSLFARLKVIGFTHEGFELNKTACLVLIALSPEGRQDQDRLWETVIALKNLKYPLEDSAEQQHALAVTLALVSNVAQGSRRAGAPKESRFWINSALNNGLPPSKALAIGHIISAAKQEEPLRGIIEKNPTLAPDLTLSLRVCSPVSGKWTTAKAIVP